MEPYAKTQTFTDWDDTPSMPDLPTSASEALLEPAPKTTLAANDPERRMVLLEHEVERLNTVVRELVDMCGVLSTRVTTCLELLQDGEAKRDTIAEAVNVMRQQIRGDAPNPGDILDIRTELGLLRDDLTRLTGARKRPRQ